MGPCVSRLAHSQSQPPIAPGGATEAGDGRLEEITVTAERRDARLQDVPIAVTALTAATLGTLGVSQTSDLTSAVPNLYIASQNQAISPFIRGIGNRNTSPGDESPTAIYVDGVYIGSPAASLFAFNNIERVEVLKGPQGTLFGRNAMAGVIQIVTKDPTQSPTGNVQVGYGNYDTKVLDAYGSSGIADNIVTDLALYWMQQGEGWGRNVITGNEAFKGRDLALRNKSIWKLDDASRLTLTLDFENTVPVTPPIFTALPNEVLIGRVPYIGFYNSESNVDVTANNKQWGAALKGSHDFSASRFVSISSYRSLDSTWSLDNDGGPAVLQQASVLQSSRELTQELQLLSPIDSRIKWILGAFYYHDNSKYYPLALQVRTTLIQIYADQKSDSYSGFSQATAEVFTATHITGGLRFTRDQRSISGYNVIHGAISASSISDQSAEFNKVTWRGALDHEFAEDLMGYASYSRGFKSGVFNAVAATTPVVKPETLDTAELGMKSEFLNRALRLNSSLFYNKFTDIQVQVSIPGGTALQNAAAGKSRGAEAELQAALGKGFEVGLSAAYLKSEYTSFANAQFYTPVATVPPATSPSGAYTVSIGNATGNELISAPPATANVNLQYSLPTAAGDFKGAMVFAYSTGFYFDSQNRLAQPAHTDVNVTLSWMDPSKHWGVRLWGKNLTDQRYYSTIVPQAFGDTATPAAPLTFGFSVSWNTL